MNIAVMAKNQIVIEKRTETNLAKNCKIIEFNNNIKEYNLLNSNNQKYEKKEKIQYSLGPKFHILR